MEVLSCKYCCAPFPVSALEEHILGCPDFLACKRQRKELLRVFDLPSELLDSFDPTPSDHVVPDYSLVFKAVSGTELYVGSRASSNNQDFLKARNIRFALNVAAEVSGDVSLYSRLQVEYLHIPCEDEVDFDIAKDFAEAGDFFKNALLSEGNVLIFCSKGVSRSTTMAIALLMSACGMSLRDAWLLVKKQRPGAMPNPGFFKALLRYENTLFPQLESFPPDLLSLHPQVLI